MKAKASPTPWLVFQLLPILCAFSNGARVLLVPWPFPSHVGQFLDVGNGLLDRGHEVHVLTSPSLPSLEKVKKSQVNMILYKMDEPDFYSAEAQDMVAAMASFMDMTLTEDFRTSIDGFKEMCTNPLKDQQLYQALQTLKFDIAIVDAFPMNRCLLVLMHRLSIPYVNLITFQEQWLMRNPALPSVTPFIISDVPQSEKMNFWERMSNLWAVIDWSAFTGISYNEDDYLKEYFYETTPVTLDELAGHAVLWLVDQTPLIDYPKPQMPNEILVGGLTTKPAKPLPDDIEKFANSNPNGLIVVSFGSMGNTLPQPILDKLIVAFELVKYNVIMRFPMERAPKTVSPHIKLMSWLPQNDILGHNNTKLFITHCGANGQVESLYHGVPMIGFPLFAEQHYNAKRSTYHGFGFHMDIRTFNITDFVAMISEVIQNSSYTKNIQKASAIFKDQPMTPSETALYWIEHVIKHGGQHLRSHALDMVWYEYLMLDILAFIIVVATIVTAIIIFMLKKIFGVICSAREKQKMQ